MITSVQRYTYLDARSRNNAKLLIGSYDAR